MKKGFIIVTIGGNLAQVLGGTGSAR